MEGPVPTAVPKSSDGEICSAAKPLEKEHGFRLRGALEWAKREWRIVCELALLIIMIVVVWGLLSLPVVFYYTTPDEVCNAIITKSWQISRWLTFTLLELYIPFPT